MTDSERNESYLRTAMYKVKECIELQKERNTDLYLLAELNWLHGYLEAGWRYWYDLTLKERK